MEIMNPFKKYTFITERLLEAHWLFAITAVVFGLFYVFITPPLWGLDEIAHFNRAYRITKGEFIPQVDSRGEAKKDMPRNLVELEYYVYGDLIDNKQVGVSFRKDMDNKGAYEQLANRSFSKNEQTAPIIATYPPIAYVASASAIFAARVIHAPISTTITLARLGSLVLYILVIWLSLRIVKNRRVKWLVLMVSLMPMSLFQGSMISADGMTIALSILFITSFIELSHKDARNKKQLLYVLLSSAVLLPLVKINYIFLSLGVLLVPNVVFPAKKQAMIIKFSSLSVCIALAGIWALVAKVAGNVSASPRPDKLPVIASDQIAHILHHPIDFIVAVIRGFIDASDAYIQSLTSDIGWNVVHLPMLFIFIICFGIIIAALYARQENMVMKNKLYVLNILATLGVLSIFGILYIMFNPTGYSTIDGVQGRYFIPFVIPISMLIGLAIPIDIKINDEIVPRLFVSFSFIVLLFSSLYFYLAVY